MKKFNLVFVLFIIGSFVFFSSCEEDDSGDGVNEATSLGNSLTFSGTVDRTFTPPVVPWATSYTNGSSNNFILNDETDDTLYATDDNTGADVDVNIAYSGTTHLAHLYSSGIWPGISSSNSTAQITTVLIEISATGNEVVYGNFSTIPVEWYYYMYSSAETILSGTFVDTSETPNENHIFDNVTVFEGWNRMKKTTSDGVTFTYSGGEISDGHWTCIDNS